MRDGRGRRVVKLRLSDEAILVLDKLRKSGSRADQLNRIVIQYVTQHKDNRINAGDVLSLSHCTNGAKEAFFEFALVHYGLQLSYYDWPFATSLGFHVPQNTEMPKLSQLEAMLSANGILYVQLGSIANNVLHTNPNEVVRFLSHGNHKIHLIKCIRKYTGMSLLDAKLVSEGKPFPFPVLTGTQLREFLNFCRTNGVVFKTV